MDILSYQRHCCAFFPDQKAGLHAVKVLKIPKIGKNNNKMFSRYHQQFQRSDQ